VKIVRKKAEDEGREKGSKEEKEREGEEGRVTM